MKALLAVIVAVALALAAAWANRLDLLMWGAPIVADLTDPIAPSVPTAWPEGPEAAARPPGERPPNIVLIFADDLGYNDVSFTNGGAADGSVQTPHIDALAREGATFTNGYAANAICAPARASIMTGRYSTRFGFEFTPFPRIGATIGEWMNEADAPLPTIIRHDLLDQLPDIREMGRHDIAATHPERVAQLQALLAAHNARQAEPMWTNVLELPQLVDKPTTEPYEEGDEYLYWPN